MTEHRASLDAAVSFANVIDAFHISRVGQPTQTRFFADERASRQGITLTDHLLERANGQQAKVVPLEVAWCHSSWPRIKKPSTCTRPPGCAAAPSPVSGPR